jgi:hypothetical protein
MEKTAMTNHALRKLTVGLALIASFTATAATSSDGQSSASKADGNTASRPEPGSRINHLPTAHRTLKIGGKIYFVVGDTWYQQQGSDYVVVAQPPGSKRMGTSPSIPRSDDLIITPRGTQDAAQMAADQEECQSWAISHSGYDPARPDSNLSSSARARKEEDYRGTLVACLDSRGYTVR